MSQDGHHGIVPAGLLRRRSQQPPVHSILRETDIYDCRREDKKSSSRGKPNSSQERTHVFLVNKEAGTTGPREEGSNSNN